jgi:hypothetical protein
MTGGDASRPRTPGGSPIAVIHDPGIHVASTVVPIGGSTFDVMLPARGWTTLSFKE